MSYFILIHTCLDSAFVALADEEKIIGSASSETPKEHGTFLHGAIQSLMKENDIAFGQVTAIGVTNGPGSYTGIRVGLSAAKGLAYALKIPMVLCSTLEALAATAISRLSDKYSVYVPVIHARRTEYYAAAFNSSLDVLTPESVVDVSDEVVDVLRHDRSLIAFGVRLTELLETIPEIRTAVVDKVDVKVFSKLIVRRFNEGRRINADAARPVYLKEAFTTTRKKRN